jgi:hypothetical protein
MTWGLAFAIASVSVVFGFVCGVYFEILDRESRR